MNLRVDLILESEQRSGSIFSPKSLLRIVTAVVPAILVILVAFAVLSVMRLKGEESALQARWDIAEPKKQAALKLEQQLAANRRILEELKGWKNSHIDWHAQLVGLQEQIPPRVQLSALTINQSLDVIDDKTPARMFAMEIEGRAIGLSAERDVQHLKERLSKTEPFAAAMVENGVQVPVYGADPSATANRQDRVFKIRCVYMPREFKEPKKKKKKTPRNNEAS